MSLGSVLDWGSSFAWATTRCLSALLLVRADWRLSVPLVLVMFAVKGYEFFWGFSLSDIKAYVYA